LPEIGWGECTVLDAGTAPVLALRYVWRNTALLTVHNFSDRTQVAHVDVGTRDGGVLCDVFDEDHSRADAAGRHELRLDPYTPKWYRVGGPDTTPHRTSASAGD
jgi:maltose alpha-D-glucosyltransferase/alpha-amylase